MNKNTKTLMIAAFLLIFILVDVASAQNRLFSDNKKLDSLTKSFQTYSIKVFVNDLISNDPDNENEKIFWELQKYFKFLKHKKLRNGDSDFEIRIDIKGTILNSPEHIESSGYNQYGAYISHQYLLNHLVSLSLFVSTKGMNLMVIKLDSNVVVKRRSGYTETNGDYVRSKDKRETMVRKDETSQKEAIQALKAKGEIWRFEKDFFYIFHNYTKSSY